MSHLRYQFYTIVAVHHTETIVNFSYNQSSNLNSIYIRPTLRDCQIDVLGYKTSKNPLKILSTKINIPNKLQEAQLESSVFSRFIGILWLETNIILCKKNSINRNVKLIMPFLTSLFKDYVFRGHLFTYPWSFLNLLLVLIKTGIKFYNHCGKFSLWSVVQINKPMIDDGYFIINWDCKWNQW